MSDEFGFKVKVFIVSVVKALLHSYMQRKWRGDQELHGLPLSAKNDYISASIRYLVKNKEFPVVHGGSLNDVIFTQKVIDRNPLRIVCCDKLGMRSYVERKLGRTYLADIYFSGDDITPSTWNLLPSEFVVKVNHDSGGVWIVRDKSVLDYEVLRRNVSDALSKRYGDIEGEWPYRYVLPKVFVEELLGEDVAPADYKFHCVKGSVCWVQYIFSRETGGKEVLIDRDGNLLGTTLSPNLKGCDTFNLPDVWGEMVRVATVLSEDFEYVRVDMYAIGARIVVGELTFFPLAGLYPVGVSNKFAQLISDNCIEA